MSSLSSALNSLLGSSNSINLTEILQAAFGSYSPGIDVNSAVNAALQAASGPMTGWQNQETLLQNQMSALTQIQTDASNLDSDMQALNSVTGPLSAMSVNSSNSSVVTATAASGASLGNTIVQVNNLATNDTWTSSVLSGGSSATLPSGTITITPPGGTATTITTGSGVNTLSDLANAINGDNLGVTANVITDASGSRLSIVSNTSGSAANFSVTSAEGSSFGFTEIAGQNASLSVNGVQISSASNTVTGVVPGMTLNLVGQSSSPVTLSVAANTSQASTAINQFVSDYNTLIQAVNTQFKVSGGSEGILASDPTVINLQSSLMESMSYTYKPSSGTTTMPNLSSMGITMNSDGTLSVDNGALSNALQNNFNDVKSFFQGASFNGFANSLDQELTNFTSPGSGAFTVDLQSMNTQYSQLQTDITNFQTNVLTPMQTKLQAEYSSAEIALQQLPSTLRNIDATLGLNTNQQGG